MADHSSEHAHGGAHHGGHQHGHDHAHHGHHGHHHAAPGSDASASVRRAFVLGILLNVIFVVGEAGAGFFAHSLALLSDASHNFGDVLGLVMAWGATVLATWRPSARFTYGLRSTTILAALFNALLLIVAVVGILWAAIDRLMHPVVAQSLVIIIAASAGLVINLLSASLFLRTRENDLNTRAAFAHMVADATVSLSVIVAGVVMQFTGWSWLDPVTGIVVGIVILGGTWHLLRQSVQLALQGVPEALDSHQVHDFLNAQPGVAEIHDLHIWAMSTTENALTAHVVMPEGHPGDTFLLSVAREIEHRFQIAHVTLQVETGHGCVQPCRMAAIA